MTDAQAKGRGANVEQPQILVVLVRFHASPVRWVTSAW